jgi:hypothetical protein
LLQFQFLDRMQTWTLNNGLLQSVQILRLVNLLPEIIR